MRAIAPLLFLLALPVSAHGDGDIDEERVISLASQLAPWCRDEAEAIVIGRGGTPYQWTASYRDRGDRLQVDGRLRVDGEDVAVRCRIARGARERYASIEFDVVDP